MRIPCKICPAGLQSLPLGYTRLEYLESTGSQYIDTEYTPKMGDETNLSFFLVGDVLNTPYVPASAGAPNSGSRIVIVLQHENWGGIGVVTVLYWLYFGNVVGRLTIDSSQRCNILFDKDGTVFVNGTRKGQIKPIRDVNTSLLLFKRFSPDSDFVGKIYSFSISHDNQSRINLSSCIDNTGTPCMFDTVTRKPFYNSGTGSFIAGIDNQAQLDNMLRKLLVL